MESLWNQQSGTAQEICRIRDMRVKPYKKDYAYSYTEGVFPTVELMDNAPDTVIKIIVSSKSANNEGVTLLENKCRALNVPFVTDDNTLSRLSPKGSLMAIGVFIKKNRLINMEHDHIVLVNPSDMGNVGTIIRTAAAFGFSDIAVIEPAADYFDPRTVRASMGAFFRVGIQSFKSFDEYACEAGKRSMYPFMLKGNDMDMHRYDVNSFTVPSSLIFGNESRGLDDSYLSVGTPLRINHLNTVDSLNLTVAAGIAMHNHRRASRIFENTESEAAGAYEGHFTY